MRTRTTLFILVTAIALALTMLTGSAWAQLPDIEVEVVPTLIQLSPSDEMQVMVIVRNPTAEQLHDVRLSWFTDADVNVAGDALQLKVLIPHGEFAWTLRLGRASEEPVSGTVHFRVDYTWRAQGEAEAVPRVAFGSLSVESDEPEAVEQVAGVEIKTTLESLNQQRPGQVYLVVTNKSGIPVHLKEIVPRGPEFIDFEPINFGPEGKQLGPHEACAVAYNVKAKDVVRPGKHLLLFEVTLEWDKSGDTQAGRLFATREVDVGILGESEILEAFGIPSFLVLPGFLMIIMVKLLWGLDKSEDEKKKFLLEVKKPEFWLVAITLSGIMAYGYPEVTGRLTGVRRNYLEGYGLTDVVQVWLSSIVLAAAAFVGALGMRNIVQEISRWLQSINQKRRVPAEDDDPLTLLRKLHRQNLGVYLDRVVLKIGGADHFGFVLESLGEDWEKLWVGPAIVVEWLEGAGVELRMQVESQLGDKGSADTLATLLERGHKAGALRVTWKQMDRLVKPYLADKADILSFEPRNLFVEQE